MYNVLYLAETKHNNWIIKIMKISHAKQVWKHIENKSLLKQQTDLGIVWQIVISYNLIIFSN
jgi:hypothetical protein